jgi:hypothetical protein
MPMRSRHQTSHLQDDPTLSKRPNYFSLIQLAWIERPKDLFFTVMAGVLVET